MDTKRLRIREVGDVPLGEISGLGQRAAPGPPGQQILVVGDEDFTVLSAELAASASGVAFEAHDVREIVASAGGSESSEWEAADGDATGRVFVLQESPGTVFVFDPSFERLLCTIDLDLEPDPDLDWMSDPNAQGEGLVLLQNGHVLVAKEKDPPLLMEFGPQRTGAEGVAPELLFSTTAEFPLPNRERARFNLLTVWELDPEAGARIHDISDVAVGPDNRLYLLSDESRCIARLGPSISPGKTALSVTKVWELPGELVQPEGLVIAGDMSPMVAIDRDEKRENLFFLEPLEG